MAARFRLGDDPHDVLAATKFALRSVARRYEALSAEIAELDAQLDRLVGQVAPELVSLAGIGTDHAATLLTVAGDNPQRLRSEASFASLCGVSPVEASSGKVVRHRLNRGGNRDANRALYMICLARMRRDPRTREYVALGAPRKAREQARDHPLPQALRRQGGLPRAGFLWRLFLTEEAIRRGQRCCWERRYLTIGPLCQAIAREARSESATSALNTASETRRFRQRIASLRDLPSPSFFR